MANGGSVYLDTNVVIALVEGLEEQSSGLQRALSELASRRANFHISSLCVAELLVLPYRNGDKALVERYARLDMVIEGLTIHPVNEVILDAAAVLRAKITKLKLPDAIHLATASIARCRHLLTYDKGFADPARLPHPYLKGSILEPVKIIRPNPDSLSELAEVLAQ